MQDWWELMQREVLQYIIGLKQATDPPFNTLATGMCGLILNF